MSIVTIATVNRRFASTIQTKITKMTPATKLTKVFVYGTLKKGEPNHYWFTKENKGSAKFVCNGKMDIKFPLVVATKYNVPFLLNVPDTGHNVHGEIYSIDSTMLSNLDELEDYPELYDRNIFKVNGSDGETHQCWVYMIKQFPSHILKTHKLLENYKDSVEQPYRETYLDSCTAEDLYNCC